MPLRPGGVVAYAGRSALAGVDDERGTGGGSQSAASCAGSMPAGGGGGANVPRGITTVSPPDASARNAVVPSPAEAPAPPRVGTVASLRTLPCRCGSLRSRPCGPLEGCRRAAGPSRHCVRPASRRRVRCVSPQCVRPASHRRVALPVREGPGWRPAPSPP